MHNKTNQSYWRSEKYPYLEYRDTRNSFQSYKMHQHNVLSIGAIFSGQTALNYLGGSKTLVCGDLIIIPANMPHSCNPINNDGRSYGMLYIDIPIFLALFQKTTAFPLNITSVFSVNSCQLFKTYLWLVDALKKEKTNRIGECVNRLLAALVIEQPLLNASQRMHRLVDKTKIILTEHIENPPNLYQLAQQVALRPETLIRLFKRYTGMTPKSYLNNLRIEKAKELLKQGNKVIDVAYQLGFSDPSHFQKIFNLYSAVTPRNYRQNSSIFDNH